jgi:myo-inositol catabolism protein IolH
VKIALDPYMFRALPIDDMVRTVAELGYEYLELSPRDDFMPFFLHPRAAESEAAFWRSLEELLPLFEREGIALNLEAHPDDFCEENTPAVDLVRAINKPWVNYLYCAPHSFHLSGAAEVGADIASMMRYAGDKLRHVHIADSFNHKGSSGLRYILNPPGTAARIHQHLDIGQGEVNWDAFFGTLRELNFDGVATACIFAWEERAREPSTFMLDRIRKELAG